MDRPVQVTIHKTLNSSKGVIRSKDLSGMSALETNDELKDQDVIDVRRVTLKKGGQVIPTNTLFLTSNQPCLPKEIKVGYLKVKVDLFIPNPLRCFNCNGFGHTNQRCKSTAKCTQCGKDKHEGGCDGPKICSNCNGSHASSAKDCPSWQKEKEIQRICVEKRISFLKTDSWYRRRRHPQYLISPFLTWLTRRRKNGKVCDMSGKASLVSSDTPVQTVRSVVCVSGGPGSVSTGTQASSGKSGPPLADARTLSESALRVDKRYGSPGAGSSSSPKHQTLTLSLIHISEPTRPN